MLDNKLSKLVEESTQWKYSYEATPEQIKSTMADANGWIEVGTTVYNLDNLDNLPQHEEWNVYVAEGDNDRMIAMYNPETGVVDTDEVSLSPTDVRDNPRVTGDKRAKLEDELAKAEGDLKKMIENMDELEIDISDMQAALDDGMLVKESKVVEENIASDLADVKVKIEDTKERLANVDSELDEVNSELDGLNISDDEEIEIEDDDNDTDDVDIEIEDDDSEDDDDKEIEIEDDDDDDDDDEEIEIEDDDDVVEESNGNITVDIDFTYPDGWEAILKEANLTGVKTGDTQLDLTGTKTDIRDYLLGDDYGMAVEDLEEIFPELS